MEQGADADRQLPPVSLVACLLNEERHVAEAFRCALDQDYPGELELVAALGPSKDGTDRIVAELAEADQRIRAVRNPAPGGATPAGLNAAIAASRNPVVVRIDGHAILPAHYVRVAVETMLRTGADNVGGVMAAEGVTVFEQAVARAMTSRLGVGNAAFHTGGQEGPVDTVYLGVFRRSALERVHGYDEAFLRAQDWEMNLRIRRTGGVVWFNPALQVSYRPRPRVGALARQYFHYGRWRRVVMRRHEGTVSPRYLAPPVALVGVLAGGAGTVLWPPALVLPLGYALLVLLGSLVEGRGLPVGAWARLPLVLATMHLSWGAGFLTSPRRLAFRAPLPAPDGSVAGVDVTQVPGSDGSPVPGSDGSPVPGSDGSPVPGSGVAQGPGTDVSQRQSLPRTVARPVRPRR